jgi:GT2 family glycosyltransferase
MALAFTIIVATKDRCHLLKDLLDSLRKLQGLRHLQPQIIVGDNLSQDRSWSLLEKECAGFPTRLEILKVGTPGKCAVLNQAIRRATGDVLAFLDDDVVVERLWLEEMDRFFQEHEHYSAGQGIIRIPFPECEDPEILQLIRRYRTIPHLEFQKPVRDLHSLNGANIAVRREVFDRIGFFNERLGPGASGTSEDVELARRIVAAGMRIGYMQHAVVRHRVDRSRLTEAYFMMIHKKQGRSRLLLNNHGVGRIFLDLCRASAQYGIYSLSGSERNKYRSKGRVYHYLGMLEAKWNA